MSDREREEFYHEMDETSHRWREACNDSKTVAEMAERLEQVSTVYDEHPIVHRLWQKGHPGSFESNHGCWDHFFKIT